MGTGGQPFHEKELVKAPATSAAWLGGAGSHPVPGGKGAGWDLRVWGKLHSVGNVSEIPHKPLSVLLCGLF